MGGRKIPDDAFEYYVDLGSRRSYQAVAENYGVTKKAVTNLAKRERWQERLAELREAHRTRTEALRSTRERRRQALDLVIRKAVEGLGRLSFEDAADAAQAVILSAREIRMLEFGKPDP